MKKIIALLLALAMLCFAGCGKGGNETPNNNDDTKAPGSTETAGTQEQEEPTQEVVDNGKITMEDLLNAPESPVEDFKVVTHDNGKVELVKYKGDADVVVIPESLGITHINSYIFANDCPVKAVRLSSTVQVIDMGAFGKNLNLELFACGSGLLEIGESAFQGCDNLREILLNDGLEKLDEYSVCSCDNLLRVEIPASVTEIAKTAFYSDPDGFVIVGEAGSAAETYAKENNITFEAK